MSKIIYDYSQIDTMDFDSTDIPELFTAKGSHGAYRLTEADIAGMPADIDLDTFRCRLSELFCERLDNDYAKLENRCDIKRDSFRKTLKFRNGRVITYTMLSKFCIGARLSIEETRELYSLLGYDLSERIRTDYILLCELARGGDITDFDESMKKYCNTSVLSNPDA